MMPICRSHGYDANGESDRRNDSRPADECCMSRSASEKGFTLLEMVISLGIFSIVIVTAVGAMLAVGNAQKKAALVQNIQDNLRFALESMTKEMRTGLDFKGDLPSGVPHAYDVFTFTQQNGTTVQYCRLDGAIKKAKTPSGVCEASELHPVTDDSIVIDDLTFFLFGEGANDGQPRVTVYVSGYSQDVKLQTSFRMQTTVTQKGRDAS